MEQLFKTFANTADGVFIINEDRRIIYWNDAAQKMLGYTPDDIIGQPCYKIMRGCDDKGKIICFHNCNVSQNAFDGQPIPNYDLATRTKSGEMRWINISILTVSPANDDSSSVIVHLFRDATKAKQNEQFIHQMFDTVEQWQKTGTPTVSPTPVDSYVEKLTEREREVLSLLAHGFGTADIAEKLSITSATARNHVQRILHKLNVHSRLEAVAYAFEHGLVSEAPPKD